MLITLANDGYGQVWLEVVPCGNAEQSESNVRCKRVLPGNIASRSHSLRALHFSLL